jgi:hypothetical protein
MAQIKASYFAEYVKKWFKILTATVVETLNGSKSPVTYHYRNMLKPGVSADGRWDSMSASRSIVAADVVDIDSPLPIKKRDAIKRAGGEIPMIGMGMSKNAKLIQRIKWLANSGATEKQVAQMIFDDLPRVVSGVYERLEFMFLQALSTGVTLVPDSENVGVGTRVDFGYMDSNRYGVTKKWGSDGYTPLSDMARVLHKALERGDVITTVALDGSTYYRMRKSDEAKALYASSIGNFAGNNLVTPSPSQFEALIADEYKVKFIVIDRIVRVEKDGKQTLVRPFAENTLVFLTTEQVGTLVYAILAEQDAEYRVKDVDYEIVDNYILVSKYSETNPLREYTNAQALVLPVIENVDSIYILNTEDAEELAAGEIEGDASFTVYGTAYSKDAVIEALRVIGKRVAGNISDARLLEKINSLSDEDEAKFRTELEGVLVVAPNELTFAAAADTTGKTVTATASGTLTAVSDQTWATVTVSGNVATVKVSANGTGAARTANVTLSADGKQVAVTVIQAA